MSLTRSQLIDTIDKIDEVRDLATVANMAISDIHDREARNGLSRLFGMICSQLGRISADLSEVSEGGNDAARS